MIKILIVLTAGLVAITEVTAEPPVYGSSTDDFDINSISSYLDDVPTSSSSDSKVLGGGTGSYSYTNFNQVSHASPTALPYKAPTPSSYPPLPGSTAATATHPTFGTSSSLTGSSYYSAPSYSNSPVQSSSYGQSLQSGSPYGQPSSHYESHVSFGSDGASYSTGYKGEHPSSSSFNFPSEEEAHSSALNDVRASPQTSYNPPSNPSFSSGSSNYKPQVSFGSSPSSSSYKDPFGPNQSFGSSGSQYSTGSFGSDSSSFGSSFNSRPTSSFDTRPPPTSSFDTRPSPSFDSKPFNSPNFGGFGQDSPSGPGGPEGPAAPWAGGQTSYPGFQDGPSPPFRNSYNSGPPPYFKDFTSYKGPHADLPYSPNSPYSGFGSRPSYSGGYSSRPVGPSYRGKYSSGSKGSRYPRHPRPGYSGNRGYSGRHYNGSPPRTSSYRPSGKSPYPPPHSRHY